MTSVERVMTYSQLEAEADYDNTSHPPKDWPREGSIQLQDVFLSYYPEAKHTLKGISVHISDGEKVGLVGRTGAGKSSIIAALLRIPNPDGEILIDGIPIKSINLQDARACISVIPQNPFLFSGSLRENLDPFSKYEDKALWSVLEDVQLKSLIQGNSDNLEIKVIENGCNFSSGERQLICLARALLQNKKIIIIDEATANVDLKTDQMIQETIRTKFHGCTVLTIAHRLCTILDYDQVIVMENGKMVEMGKPHELLQNHDSYFFQVYRAHSQSLSN